MTAMLSEPLYLGWVLTLLSFAGLVSWKYRRLAAERRVAKGLRSYTVRPQVLS